MEFIIQHNLIAEEPLHNIKHAVKDLPHRFVGVIPFSHEITSDAPLIGTNFIPYGSTLLTTIAGELGWKGLHFDKSTFTYEAAMKNRRDMLNTDMIMTLDDAIEFLKGRPRGETWFTRPSEDLKQYSGQVIDAEECWKWFIDARNCESSGTYNLSGDTMVVLSAPKVISAEWRWFIIGGRIVDGSMYRANGQLIKKHEVDSNVIYEAQVFSDDWLPDSCCVMDLALVGDELKVIEFNTLNSSGTYNHNTDKIFQELYRFHTK